VMEKITNQQEEFASIIHDLNDKVVALDSGITELRNITPLASPVVQTIRKIPVEVHARRIQKKTEPVPVTDLTQFRVPPEMQEKLEHKIMQLYTTNIVVEQPEINTPKNSFENIISCTKLKVCSSIA